MGNINSKHKSKKIPEFCQIESNRESREKLLEFYLTNDNDSIDRMHMYHFIKRCIFQSNFSSPIEDELINGGSKVLDIGCGPGTWLLDLSNKYRNSYFFGVDIKPLFPQEIKPSNLDFIEADIINGLPFRNNEFDFTHIASMGCILTNDQWDFILSELNRVTKPGGHIEIAGKSNSLNGGGPILCRLSDGFLSVFSKRNIDPTLTDKLDSKFELQPNIGKVHRIEEVVTIGPNGGKIGLVIQDLLLSYWAAEMVVKIMSNELGISEEEYKNLVEGLTEELKHTNPWIIHVRYWAQKVQEQ